MENKLYAAMSLQVNFEIHSSHIYVNMATYFESIGLEGFANFFWVQFEEETFHARKMMTFLSTRGYRPAIEALPKPMVQFESPLQAFEAALAHEKIVSGRIHELMKLARESSDFAAESLLGWFINEQVEEEANFEMIVTKVRLVKDAGLYLLDQELAARTFVAPVN